MNDLHAVQITGEGPITKVSIDGKEIKGIRKVEYIHEANCAPILKVELYTKATTIDNTCVLDVSNAFKRE